MVALATAADGFPADAVGQVRITVTADGVSESRDKTPYGLWIVDRKALTMTHSRSGVAFNVSDSSFTNNWSSGCTFLATSSSKNHGPSRFVNCTVSGNCGRLIAASGSNAGDSWPNPNLEFDACTFTDNSRANLTADSSYLLIGGGERYYPVIFRDCYIAGNCCTNTGSGVLALAYTYGYHRYTFLDCTIEKNVVVSTAAGGRSAITCLNNVYGGVNVVGSLLVLFLIPVQANRTERGLAQRHQHVVSGLLDVYRQQRAQVFDAEGARPIGERVGDLEDPTDLNLGEPVAQLRALTLVVHFVARKGERIPRLRIGLRSRNHAVLRPSNRHARIPVVARVCIP